MLSQRRQTAGRPWIVQTLADAELSGGDRLRLPSWHRLPPLDLQPANTPAGKESRIPEVVCSLDRCEVVGGQETDRMPGQGIPEQVDNRATAAHRVLQALVLSSEGNGIEP